MTIAREKDEHGESFAHEVNGVKIFAMGADYIPEDNILSRVTPERTRKLLEQCVAANFNCVRVWGGGYYPSDEFYDICDELGLVVWQDFTLSMTSARMLWAKSSVRLYTAQANIKSCHTTRPKMCIRDSSPPLSKKIGRT